MNSLITNNLQILRDNNIEKIVEDKTDMLVTKINSILTAYDLLEGNKLLLNNEVYKNLVTKIDVKLDKGSLKEYVRGLLRKYSETQTQIIHKQLSQLPPNKIADELKYNALEIIAENEKKRISNLLDKDIDTFLAVVRMELRYKKVTIKKPDDAVPLGQNILYEIDGYPVNNLETYARKVGMTNDEVMEGLRSGNIHRAFNQNMNRWYILHSTKKQKWYYKEDVNRDARIGAFILTATTIYLIFFWIVGTTGLAILITVILSIGMLISIATQFPGRWSAWYWSMGGFSKTVRQSILMWMFLFFSSLSTIGIYKLYYKILGGKSVES